MPAPKGNQNRLVHGGAAAEKALTTGADFTGLAREVERVVSTEFELHGVDPIVKRGAIRLQTVADIYFAAILGAENLEKLDSLVKRFGWIQGSALRAWSQIRDNEEKLDHIDASVVLKAIKDKRNELKDEDK